MSYIVRVIGSADGGRNPHENRFVKAWDAHTEFGMLKLTSTDKPSEARRFVDTAQVHREWSAVSDVQTYRPDGRLNRPLTGIHIEIVRLK